MFSNYINMKQNNTAPTSTDKTTPQEKLKSAIELMKARNMPAPTPATGSGGAGVVRPVYAVPTPVTMPAVVPVQTKVISGAANPMATEASLIRNSLYGAVSLTTKNPDINLIQNNITSAISLSQQFSGKPGYENLITAKNAMAQASKLTGPAQLAALATAKKALYTAMTVMKNNGYGLNKADRGVSKTAPMAEKDIMRILPVGTPRPVTAPIDQPAYIDKRSSYTNIKSPIQAGGLALKGKTIGRTIDVMKRSPMVLNKANMADFLTKSTKKQIKL